MRKTGWLVRKDIQSIGGRIYTYEAEIEFYGTPYVYGICGPGSIVIRRRVPYVNRPNDTCGRGDEANCEKHAERYPLLGGQLQFPYCMHW